MHTIFAPLELKLAADSDGTTLGVFSGYASVFGNVDSHGDVIVPGAFRDTLAQRVSDGRKNVPMHVQHAVLGGDGLPIGVWTLIEEDEKGLRVEGKISGVANTDAGRLHWERVKDGAYGGLSIGFRTLKSSEAKGANGAKRNLEVIDLREISLVTDPSNAQATIEEIKVAERQSEERKTIAMHTKAATAIAACMKLHRQSMAGGDSPNAEERGALFTGLQDAHEALTGQRMPDGMKAVPTTIREAQDRLKEIFDLSQTQARGFAEHGFKGLRPREEGSNQAAEQEAKAVSTAKDALSFLTPTSSQDH